MSEKKKTIRGIMCALAGGTFWGLSGVCGQYVFMNSTMESGNLTAIRMFFSGLLLLSWCLFREKGKIFTIWKHGRDVVHLLVYTLGGLVFIQYSYLSAIKHSNSGTATVLQYTGIIIIMLVNCCFRRKMPVKKEIMAAILALTGIFLLATHGNPSQMALSSSGLIWGIMAAIALMTYTILPTKIIRKWGNFLINGFGMLIGGIILCLVFRIWEQEWDYKWSVLLAIAGVVLAGTLLATCLYSQGVSDIGPVKASMAACVEPLVATVISCFWLHTRFVLMDIIGFVLIMGGVIIATMPDTNRFMSDALLEQRNRKK